MKIENRQQTLVILASVVIGLFLGDRLIFSPMIAGWKTRSAAIADLDRKIKTGKDRVKLTPRVRAQWEQMKTNTLSADNAERRVLEAFDRWSRAANVSISSIQPQWKRAEDYSTLECHANATGPVNAIAKFLYQLENDPMALRIESMEIASRDDNGQNLSLTLQVSGLVLGAPVEQ